MTESTISLALALIAIYGHLTSAQALSPHLRLEKDDDDDDDDEIIQWWNST